MLKKHLIQRAWSPLLHRISRATFAEASGFKPGDKAPTLSTATIPMNVETFEGQMQRIFVQVGSSLWSELQKNGINIGGFCGGGEYSSLREKRVDLAAYGPYCKSCYCAIDEPWYSNLPQTHDFEIEILSMIPESYPANTRFACSLEVEGWMEEMIIRVLTDRNEFGTPNEDYSEYL